jgi:hypothetical protein
MNIFPLLIIIFSIPFLFSIFIGKSTNGIQFDALISGFFYYIFIITLISLSPLSNIFSTASLANFTMFFSLISLLIIFKNIKKFKMSSIIVVFILFYFLLYFFDLHTLRFHASPDNHGFAAAVGNFVNNFSHSALVDKYLSVSGLNEPVFYGQPTPLLPSTWSIADSQLRWTSDIAFTVGRVGLPLLGALSVVINDSILINFDLFVIIIGVFGAISSAYLIFETFKIISEYFLKINFDLNHLYLISIIFFLGISNYLLIFILEGAIAQLWCIVAIQFYIFQLLKFLFKIDYYRSTVSKYIIMSSAPIFISVIYPHAFLLLIAISSPLLTIIILKYRSFLPALTCLLCFPGLFVLLSVDSIIIPLKMFLNGVAGSSYHLGATSIFQYFPFHHYSIFPINAISPPRGYDIAEFTLQHMRNSIIVLSIFSILIFSLALYKFKKIRADICFIFLILFILLIPLAKSSYAVSFQSYIFARHSAIFASIGIPILLSASFCYLYMYFNNFKINVTFFKKIVVSSFILSSIFFIISLNTFSERFILNSKKFSVIDHPSEILNLSPKTSIFVSDDPLHEMFYLNLVSPIYYLTDTWSPLLKKEYFDNNLLNVYEVELINNKLHFTKIGFFRMTEEIRGPVTATEIKSLPNFSPI